MSRTKVWALMSLAGLSYWCVVYGFHPTAIHHFAGPVWFGGMALFVHWMLNRSKP